jgi:hypothetical protein
VSSYAIVVGINQYPVGANQTQLFGAVSDAMDFAEWALHPDGGNVPAANMHFWTFSPTPAPANSRLEAFQAAPSPWWNPGAFQPDATRAPTVDEIYETGVHAAQLARGEKQNQGTDSRLFVFFAGHGVQGKTQADLETQTCFLTNDYQGDADAIRGLVPSEDFRIAMLAKGFAEVFMFLDCCRVNLVRSNAVVRALNGSRVASPSNVKWGTGYAADPDNVAWETPEQNPTRGAFSKVLVEGLRRVRDANNTLTAYALEDYVTNRIDAVVHPRVQQPLFIGGSNLRALKLASGPPIKIGDEDVVINLGGLPAGTQVHLKAADGTILAAYLADAVDKRFALEVGRLYSLETADGTVERGFLHGAEGDRHVSL